MCGIADRLGHAVAPPAKGGGDGGYGSTLLSAEYYVHIIESDGYEVEGRKVVSEA